ncbi:hypothetical protein [Mucilaginibacter polytrichastri]|uniref:Uncharacterized protein n=1 Tax=Mucilaginibacter polytrichastri TaxID=1302689 RepID=A0A1Q5ZZW3_9SPHI|nr:hypothetical protein [Mucilaginibacter polytrichastri]OKS87286.1 hypothetical protein RG47T_2745 [Mucilaginibacter polytrichastri]SFT18510.1 hypothetical protein SAMN04487890_11515 [Mucilaginibacter polytrichastri]
MRNLLLLLFLCCPFFVKAQYSYALVSNTDRPTLLVGTLGPNNTGNYQKLQVDVFGGGWGANTLGKTTYYVGNRNGITITQTTMGSASSSFTIKAYAQSNGTTNIYLICTADYASFAVNSLFFAYNTVQAITVGPQTPTGIDITPIILPVMITDQNGNISLNTIDNKGYKLAVNGSAIATSVTVKLYDQWSDYVFDKEYDLATLKDVKSYINKHHHLSEIPSADEVARDGVNLGEMNAKLLKKIEELTLYLIEKDKQLNDQQDQLNKIKNKLGIK